VRTLGATTPLARSDPALLAKRVVFLVLFAAFPFLVYRAIFGRFFPSPEVRWLAAPPALAIATWFAVKGTRDAARRGHPEAFQRRWFRWLFGYLLMPPCLGVVIWLALAKGAGGLVDGLIATSSEELLTVAAKQEHLGRSGCRYAIYIEELFDPGGGGFPLCVSRESFEATEIGSRIRARVRRSFLGTTVE